MEKNKSDVAETQEHSLDTTKIIVTLDEWETILTNAGSSSEDIILQIGADWCKNCSPVHQQILTLNDEYNFKFIYSDARNSELVDHFEVSKLPTVVVYNPSKSNPFTVQHPATIASVVDIIPLNTRPRFRTDEDF